jgi:hypothetical protein
MKALALSMTSPFLGPYGSYAQPTLPAGDARTALASGAPLAAHAVAMRDQLRKEGLRGENLAISSQM